jgi:ABC-2 type transport system ATP-binding protein
MSAVEVSHIAKSFGETQAVADVSFRVKRGEIFGLLGPNGSGKTTTIRLLLDIFSPDAGAIAVLGGPMDEEKKDRIGYMPEERGLYQEMPLERCLLYLASLKGVGPGDARPLLARYLHRFDLEAHKGKKIKALSKGMQQKAQIINTLLHQPELVIIDEPFTALDPVNLQLVKDVMVELRDEGVTILMSTHQMRQVEELCDRILLIDEGRDVLYGRLKEIRRRFSGHELLVRPSQGLPALSGVEEILSNGEDAKLTLQASASPQEILAQIVAAGVALEKFEIAFPTLDEIFIRVVEGKEPA